MIETQKNELKSDYIDRVINVSRVAKVVKGGRRFSFSALVVIGNKNGSVGSGLGKANEVPEAIRKGTEQAKKNIIHFVLKDKTIPHMVIGVFGAGRVLLKPALEGTGVIASSTIRSVLEVAGVRDISTKSLSSNNPHNVVKATINGLKNLCSNKEYIDKLKPLKKNDLI